MAKRQEELGFETYLEMTLSCGTDMSLPINPNDTDTITMAIANYANTPGRFLPVRCEYYDEPVFIRADKIQEFSVCTREEIRAREKRNAARGRNFL
jgi:hypothetical protein